MTRLLRIPVEDGGWLIAEVDPADLAGAHLESDDLDLASPDPGRAIARSKDLLSRSITELKPVLDAVRKGLESAAPTELSLEFGIKLGGETGVILAKGTVDVNFAVKMIWKRGTDE